MSIERYVALERRIRMQHRQGLLPDRSAELHKALDELDAEWLRLTEEERANARLILEDERRVAREEYDAQLPKKPARI